MEMTKYEVGSNDFHIQISPSVDENHNWTGEISINLILNTNTSLCDDDYYKLLMLTKTICASVPMYEDYPDLYDKAIEYVAKAEAAVDDTEGEDPYFFKQEYTTEDNVISVNFKNKDFFKGE